MAPSRKFSKTGMELCELFLSKADLLNAFVRKHSGHKLAAYPRTRIVQKCFWSHPSRCREDWQDTPSVVAAEGKRTFNSLAKIERKLLKAEKRFQSDKLRQMEEVKMHSSPMAACKSAPIIFEFLSTRPRLHQKILGCLTHLTLGWISFGMTKRELRKRTSPSATSWASPSTSASAAWSFRTFSIIAIRNANIHILIWP